METKKMSLASIQGMLSRTEMKKIMAGSTTCKYCSVWSDCGGGICGTWAGRCNGAKHCF